MIFFESCLAGLLLLCYPMPKICCYLTQVLVLLWVNMCLAFSVNVVKH